MEHNHNQSEENKDFSNASIDGMLFLVDEELFLLIFLYAFERMLTQTAFILSKNTVKTVMRMHALLALIWV